MLTLGSLFTGIGGLDRGIEQGLAELGHVGRVVWQAEKDPYARAVLARHWPRVHCFEDVHDIDDRVWRPDLIGGGFPCQDLSIAGKRAGIDGARSGLWSEFVRIIRVLRPSVVLVENVPELLAYLGRVLGPLAELGYDAEWDLFDAASVGAPHRRERLFVLAHRPGALAHADGDGQLQSKGREQGERRWVGDDGANVPDASGQRDDGCAKLVAYTHGERREGGLSSPLAATPRPVADPMLPRRPRAEDGPHEGRNGPAVGGRSEVVGDAEGDGRRAARADAWQGGREAAADGAGWRWPPEPDVGRVVDGPASRLDARRRRARLRCLGNGVVEQQAALALVTLATRAGLAARPRVQLGLDLGGPR